MTLRVEITEIKNTRSSDEVIVCFEGGSFRLPRDMTLLYDLRPGRIIDIEDLEQIRLEGAQRLALFRGARLASNKQMSRKELEDKLVSKGEDREHAEAAVERLEELGAVNDLEYAKNVVRSYCARGYGKGRVIQEFRRRGIPRDLWDEALEGLSEPEEAIDKFLRSHLRDAQDEKNRKRCADALYRRGFEWDDIRSGLRRASAGEEY